MKTTEPLESEIQNSICEYLAIRKVFFSRINNIPAMTRDGGFRKMPKYAKLGMPDIVCVVNGTFVGLEVKRLKGVQSEGQKAFQRDVTLAGGKYYVVRSIDDVQAIGL